MQEYAEKDNRIIIINQENQGQGVARNNGIDIASGEYIAFVDPDDYIDIDTFEFVYNKFKETGVDIVEFDYQTCDEEKSLIEYHSLIKEMKKVFKVNIKDNEIFCLKDYKQFLKNRLCVWDKIYSTDLIKQNNINFSPKKIGEDNIVSISATALAKNILYINKYFYHYRIRQNSTTHKTSDNNFGVFENIKLLKEFLNAIKPNCNFLQKIFSIKNTRIHGIKYKYLYILGLKFIIYKKDILLKKMKGIMTIYYV